MLRNITVTMPLLAFFCFLGSFVFFVAHSALASKKIKKLEKEIEKT